ncbi:MAG: thiamine-phosphate kinase [Acidimicrobiales bacterium]
MKSPNSGDRSARNGDVDEFAAIERLRHQFESAARSVLPGGHLPPPGDTWIGDDAAVIAMDSSDQVLWATDLVVEGVHFDLDLVTLGDAGYKALMVAVSDLAAMGAWPRFVLVSIAAPAGTDLELLGVGLAEAAVESGCVVVGGDLSQSPTLVVSTAVMGTLRADPDRGPLLRSGARPSDLLFVTGPLGGSAAGLRLLRSGDTAGPAAGGLVRAYRRPVARLSEGEVARMAGATAAIDISDGLASDLRHLGASSGVGIALDAVPVADGATEAEALGGGEEYELLVTSGDADRLMGSFRAAGLRLPLAIGRCTDQPGRCTLEGRPLSPGGWHHRF